MSFPWRRIPGALARRARRVGRRFEPTRLARTLAYHLGAYESRPSHRIPGLHLGCGGVRIPTFLHVDASLSTECDIAGPVDRLRLATGTVDVIYCSHVFEHVPRQRAADTLREWHRVLRPGGTLYIGVPDVEALFRLYLEHLPAYDAPEARATCDLAADVVYGGQVNEYDFHFAGYSFASLRRLLERTGFTDVRRFDRDAEAVCPPRDATCAAIGDVLVSLNVRATKA